MHPCGTPVFRMRVEEVCSSKVQNPITHRKVLMPRSLSMVTNLEMMMEWNSVLKSINTARYIDIAVVWVEMKASSTDLSACYRSWWRSSDGEWKSFDVSQTPQRQGGRATEQKSFSLKGNVWCPSEFLILERKWEQHLIMWPSLCKQYHNSVHQGTWKTPHTVMSTEESLTKASESIKKLCKNVSESFRVI